jgi:dipeptidyl aminopeptidase/acylaminoacyl peptidase
MGVVRHSESYRCAIASMAVTDPRLLFQWSYMSDQSDEARSHDYPTLIGHPVNDLAMLEAATPVLRAREIKVPVLLVMGADDQRVPLEHGQRMRAALVEAGNPPLWHVYAGEGHGFFKAGNEVDFMLRVEAFLSQHTRPR